MGSLIFFASAILVGYFLLPLFIKKDTLSFLISHPTSFEAKVRDRALKPMTDQMGFITPNAITYTGLILVVVLIYLFLKGVSFKTIFVVALIAGFTDMLDGSLARNTGQVSKLGAVLDVTRDILITLVLSYFLISRGFLWLEYFIWFVVGWIFLGFVRLYEFKLSSGKALSFEEDYKFALDRVRIFLYILGILLLILTPYSAAIGVVAEILIIAKRASDIAIGIHALGFFSSKFILAGVQGIEP